ncbi:ABC transporter permease [bacterium]|nr:MAG: ABC transporter permease [bacterium]
MNGTWEAQVRRARRLRSMERMLRLASPIALLLLWECAVRVRVLDARFFPAPSSVVAAALGLARTGELWGDLRVTLLRLVLGFFAGAVPGIALGMLMGLSRWVRAVASPLIAALYPIPKIAVLPLIILIFGLGDLSKIVTVAIGVFFIMAINTSAGVLQIDRIYLDVAKAYGVRGPSYVREVLLPGALPSLLTGAKVSLGIALILVVAAEFLAAKDGLGYLIWNGWQTLQVEQMYVGLVIVAVIGYVVTIGLEEAERLALPWLPR